MMITRITIGRGKNRRVFDVPTDKIGREQATEDLKDYAARPQLFKARMGLVA